MLLGTKKVSRPLEWKGQRIAILNPEPNSVKSLIASKRFLPTRLGFFAVRTCKKHRPPDCYAPIMTT